MQSRRQSIVIALVALTVLTAGCAGLLQGEDSFEFTAEPASVSDSAVSDTGFVLERNDSVTVERDISIGGNETTITITNRVHVYKKQIQDANVSFFVALSTPKVTIAGQAFNPLGSMETESLLERVVAQQANVKDIEPQGSSSVEILGETRTVDQFTAVAVIEQEEFNVTLHVTRFPNGDDYVIAIAIYPTEYPGEENMTVLMRGIEHQSA